MELFNYFSIFLLGVACGFAAFMGYGFYQIRRMKKITTKLVDKISKKTTELELETKKHSIKERLLRAAEIAKMQMELRSQLEMPSNNALHSKHKNSVIFEIQDLEHDKLSILRSVLGDGFDPVITVLNDSGHQEQIPLSTYVAQAEQLLNNKPTGDLPPAPPTKTKKVGKLILHKGGKDDGTIH